MSDQTQQQQQQQQRQQQQQQRPPTIPHSLPPAQSTSNSQAQDEQLIAPSSIEMTKMKDGTAALDKTPTAPEQPPLSLSGPVRTDTATALVQAEQATSLLSTSSSPPPPVPPHPNPSASGSPSKSGQTPSFRGRAGSTAIGPSTDSPIVPLKDDPVTKGPTLVITLLLTSGARHPFKLDGRYLQKRNVEVEEGNPYNLSVYKLKELILREWRDEWESKPSSPSSIRLISFGKLLDDKAALKDARLSDNSANVIHMTIKPQDFVEEDDGGKAAKAAFANTTNPEQRSPGCRCVIL